MSSIFSTERHRVADNSLPRWLADLDTLMGYIKGYHGSCDDADNIKALGAFIRSRGAAGIPWLRMYKHSPECQQQSRLLNKALEKDDVLQGGAKVFFTHVKPRSRKALEGGAWHSRLIKAIDSQFVINKLYYVDDGQNKPQGPGFTLLEFVLAKGREEIAICVLHRKGYVHLARDLKQYADEGNYSGENQANNVAAQHQLAPINSAHTFDAYGPMNGSQVLHSTNPVFNSEAPGGRELSGPCFSASNDDFWMTNIPYFGLDD